MKKKLIVSVALVMVALTLSLVALAAAVQPRIEVVCPRCSSYGGTASYINNNCHNMTCTCGTVYQQWHYDYNSDGKCDACKRSYQP